MNVKNADLFKFLGIDKWHAAGYTGSRVAIGNGESWRLDEYNPRGLCSQPISTGTDNEHGESVCRVIHEFAPDCHIIYLPFTSTAYQPAVFSYIRELKIPVLTLSTSTSGRMNSDTEEYLLGVEDITTCCIAAGNDGDDAYNGRIKSPSVLGIAAYMYNKGNPTATGYSSESEYVDFCAPTNIYMEGMVSYFTGTSCATPSQAAMIVLIQDFFMANTGCYLGRKKMTQFLMDNVVDMMWEGHDEKTGFGYVKLPDPDTIDIWKYSEVERMDIKDFKDFDKIPEWAQPAVQTVVDAGLMVGRDNNCFDPMANITRCEVAQVIANLMEYFDRIYK